MIKKAILAYLSRKKLENVAFFDKWSKTYDNFIFSWWMRHLYDKTVKEVPPYFSGKILDVGCATGSLLARLRRKIAGPLFGIDLSGEMIKKARAKLAGLQKIKVAVADVDSLPFKNESFDYVVSTLMLHHLQSPLRAINEIRRVLRKGGKFVLIDSSFFLPILNYLARRIEPGFVKMYTEKEFKYFFQKAGLRLLKQKRIGVFAILNVGIKI